MGNSYGIPKIKHDDYMNVYNFLSKNKVKTHKYTYRVFLTLIIYYFE